MKLIVTVSGTYRYLQNRPFLTVTVQFSDRYCSFGVSEGDFWGIGEQNGGVGGIRKTFFFSKD